MRATITSTTTIETPLCVKELAAKIGVSTHYVYQMRAAGFPMRWDTTSHCYVTTWHAALRWRETRRFRLVRGRGRLKA